MGAKRNILVVYAHRRSPLRVSVADHLFCFGRHAGEDTRVFYLNLATRGVPRYLRRVRFELVVFHTLLLSTRWRNDLFRRLLGRARPLRELHAVKVAMPQDEFLDTRSVEDLVLELGVDHVLSVAPSSEWPKLYPRLTGKGVAFHQVLTGYLEQETCERIDALASQTHAKSRSIDVGYRAWHAAPWLGRHGQLKVRVAEAFASAAPRAGFVCDISTRAEDTLFGEDWLRFLLRCRWTVGAPGGASLLDRNGCVRERTEDFLARQPGAAFDRVEKACFPGRDGELQLSAVSPRHLEACATRTAQALVAGDYSGVLEEGRHYLPVKPDFSNLSEVVEALGDECLRRDLADRAYRDVVASGRYCYATFVRWVTGLGADGPEGISPRRAWGEALAAAACSSAERLSWLGLALVSRVWASLERRLLLEPWRRRRRRRSLERII